MTFFENEQIMINYVIDTIKTKKTDGIFIDVGARVGEWTNLLIEHFPNEKFLCFEPDKIACEVIRNKNNSNIEIFNCGLSNENKKEKLNFAINRPSHSSFIMRPHFIYEKMDVEEIVVDVCRLDSLVNQNINYLKIDTEGYEYNVLKGASKLLENNKIEFIQFEYGGTFREIGVKLNDVIGFLKDYDYGVYEMINGKPNAILNYVDNYQYNNFIATKYTL
jgi:FkbM family methyltransferase